MAPSCKIELARFSARLGIQDGAECGKNWNWDIVQGVGKTSTLIWKGSNFIPAILPHSAPSWILSLAENLASSILQAPWRIRTLKYLEMKIEEWPSRAKWGQAGSNRTKWCQMVPNRVKRGQMGSNGAKNGQKVPYRAKPGQKGQRGQTRPNGVIWGWFFAWTQIFMRLKNLV